MHVVIVGGGFAGIKAALELSKRHVGKITLISDRTYFLHHATLYATATGQSSEESVIPLRAIFAAHPQVNLVTDTIVSLAPERSVVSSATRDYHYDKLILALGLVNSFHGVKGAEKYGYSIRSLEAIQAFQDHIHEEVVSHEFNNEYFVIGGGPTGVELAAALDVYLTSLKSLYRLKGSSARVSIIEQAERIVPQMSYTATHKISHRLKKQGVKVILNHRVDGITSDYVSIDGERRPASAVLWASGAISHPFYGHNAEHFHFSDSGQVMVTPYLEALDDVYVIGDNSAVEPHATAWSAVAQARYVARAITRSAKGLPQHAYHTHRHPQSIPVGYKWGYVEWYGIYIAGVSGWVVRRWIELYSYRQLLPLKRALPLWRAHDLSEIDTTID